MRIGVIGTGIVGMTIATHLLKKGHQVMTGSRKGTNEKTTTLSNDYPGLASHGTFADASLYGSIIFNCVMGMYSLDAARLAGEHSFNGKIIIDTTNPVDFSAGMPPRLTICNDNSAGEMLQKLLPESHVVKAFNTVPYEVMIDPGMINNKNIDMFICGNHERAKAEVTEMIVTEFAWNRENIIDLGDLKHARSTEALLPFSCSIAMRFGTFNSMIKIYRN